MANDFVDDPSIPNDEPLWRRIRAFPGWLKEGVPTALAFLDRTSPLGWVSVHRSSLTSLEWVAANFPEFGVWAIAASVPRELNNVVVGTPTEFDPSHADIRPLPELTKPGRKEAARLMAAAAQLIRDVP